MFKNTMKKLIIIGARGFGREVYDLAKVCTGYGETFVVKGFLDDNKDVLNSFNNYPPILNSVDAYDIEKNDVFVCALGDVRSKEFYINIIKQKKGSFMSLIHPTAIVNDSTLVGKGIIIGKYAVVSCDGILGDHVVIQAFCALGHDFKVGNYSYLGAFSFMGGYSVLEEMVTLYARASILPHKTVKKGAIVGVNSVVMRNVAQGVTVHGNPAKKITL